MTRRLLLAMLMAATVGAHAAASPPAVNFSLQWRVMPWPPPPVPVVAPGSVTVSTTGTTTAPGSQTTHTATAEAPVPRLVVRNGGQAQITLRRDDVSTQPDWVWTALGQGIESRTRRHGQRHALWVRVQWAGGSVPAQLSFRFEHPLPDTAAPGSDTAQQLDGDLLLTLDQWQEVGHWAAPDGTGQALQLRLSRLP